MPSTVRHSNSANKVAFPFPTVSVTESYPPAASSMINFHATAVSIEFVAKPQEAHRAKSAIPSALAGAFKEVAGFAGCLVMASDQEARLLTVVTLWSGNERQKLCNENLRWARALLAPYLDRCLRVQILNAHLPMLAAVLPDDSSLEDCLSAEEETSCVA